MNRVSSPGTRKTTFLKETLTRLAARGEACAETSAKRGTGLTEWLDYLAERRAMLKAC